jgi:uncharacterized protein YbjQ (UPF0145 family)
MTLEEFIALFSVLLVFFSPLILFFGTWWIGGMLERNHYRSIRTREAALLHLPAITMRTADSGRQVAEARLVTGCVVVSNDYFKKVLASLRKIFGGRLRSYESLVDRARREAVLRMKESSGGADAILNVRLETSTISRTSRDRGMGAIEVVAYGTAIRYQS